MTVRRFAYLVGAIPVAGAAVWIVAFPRDRGPDEIDLASLSVPILTTEEQAGCKLFNTNCTVYQGDNAVGSDQGPLLVHRIYGPSHHGDVTFVLATKWGVPAHQLRFGNMTAVEGASDENVL